MKISRISLVLIVSVLAAILLSSCAGGTVYNTWPGVSAKDGVVYLAYLNGVFAVKDGTMLWRYPEKPEPKNSFYAPPSFSKDQVVAGDYLNQVQGIDPQKNGAQVWVAKIDEVGNMIGSPLVVGDTVLAPSSDHSLHALDLSGNLKWSFATEDIVWAQPVSDGKVVFQPAMDHNLYAINLSDGKQLWKKDLSESLPSSPQIGQDGTLYIANLGGQVLAINPADGNILWTATLAGELWSSPLLVEDTLYVGSSNGKVYLVSTDGGKVQKEIDLGSPVIGGGALFGDNVVFPTEGGGMFAINPEGNMTSWKPVVNGKLYSTPVVVNDQVVVAVKDGDKLLAAFDENGAEVWSFVIPK